MRRLALLLSLVALTAGMARAAAVAEPIPADLLQQFAPFAIELVKQQVAKPPVAVDPAVEKAVGYHVDEKVGVVAFPDRNLTAQALDEQGEKEVAVGAVALKSGVLQDGETPPAAERLSLVDFNMLFKLPIFFLTCKAENGEKRLLVYSRDEKPLMKIALKKEAGNGDNPLGMQLTDIDLDKGQMKLTFSVAGVYQGSTRIAVKEY